MENSTLCIWEYWLHCRFTVTSAYLEDVITCSFSSCQLPDHIYSTVLHPVLSAQKWLPNISILVLSQGLADFIPSSFSWESDLVPENNPDCSCWLPLRTQVRRTKPEDGDGSKELGEIPVCLADFIGSYCRNKFEWTFVYKRDSTPSSWAILGLRSEGRSKQGLHFALSWELGWPKAGTNPVLPAFMLRSIAKKFWILKYLLEGARRRKGSGILLH